MSSVVDKPQAARSFLSYFIAITKMRNIGQHEVYQQNRTVFSKIITIRKGVVGLSKHHCFVLFLLLLHCDCTDQYNFVTYKMQQSYFFINKIFMEFLVTHFFHLELGPLIHLDSTQLFMEIQVNTLSALLHTNDVDHVNTQTSGW